jgi:MFS family permease
VLLATVLGSGMAFIDGTVVNIALPQIGHAFGAGAAGLEWVVNAYTLTLAAFILLGGTLGDRFGRRRLFMIGVCWFAVASLLCGLAPNITMLVAARALQGVGGAMLAPGSLAILQSSFSPDDRMRAIGAWSGPLLCALALIMVSRVGAHAAYLTDVLPALTVLGVGLSLTVAPLTATALAAAQDRNAGLASGVNNAVARTAGLLAIAILPLVSGVGTSLTNSVTLAPAYRTSMLLCATLLAIGAVIALVTIPSSYAAIRAQSGAPPTADTDTALPRRAVSPVMIYCAIGAPPLHPAAEEAADQASSGARSR